jgi:transcriptional regulator with XRE-family HTH domain
MITAPQIRAARALLGWSQLDLVRESGVSASAIKNIERGSTDYRASTLAAIRTAFETAGVIFLDPGVVRAGGAGVRFKE